MREKSRDYESLDCSTGCVGTNHSSPTGVSTAGTGGWESCKVIVHLFIFLNMWTSPLLLIYSISSLESQQSTFEAHVELIKVFQELNSYPMPVSQNPFLSHIHISTSLNSSVSGVFTLYVIYVDSGQNVSAEEHGTRGGGQKKETDITLKNTHKNCALIYFYSAKASPGATDVIFLTWRRPQRWRPGPLQNC